MENKTLYQLALARIKGIGPVHTKNLIAQFGDAESVFRATRTDLQRSGLNAKLIDAILNVSDLTSFRQELKHLERIGARAIFFTDRDYPRRLLDIPHAPAVLFYQGVADLNAAKIIAIAGTRKPSNYGREVTANLVQSLASPDLVILSGLAYGIDAVAHATAIRCHVPTIGVLGHGLDHLYPAHHRGLSNSMRRHGGLLTSFLHEKTAERFAFPLRNRIVAGLCDALIIIESGTIGGSLSTAEAACKLQKKIFAVPGRINDEKSSGCLQLLHEQKALPFISADQLKAAIGWDCPAGQPTHQQTLSFAPIQQPNIHHPKDASEPVTPPPIVKRVAVESTPAPQASGPDVSRQMLANQLVDLLREREPLSFEDFITLTRQPIPSLSVALLRLEINGAIRSLPGRRYRLEG